MYTILRVQIFLTRAMIKFLPFVPKREKERIVKSICKRIVEIDSEIREKNIL